MGQVVSMQDIKIEILKVWNYYGTAYVKILFGTRKLYFKRDEDSKEDEITEVRYDGKRFETIKTFNMKSLGVGSSLYESFKRVYNALIKEQEHIEHLDEIHSRAWGPISQSAVNGEEWYMENHDWLH
jgi:hypothetical protein